MRKQAESFRISEYWLFLSVTLAVTGLCICVGSVPVPLTDTVTILKNALLSLPQPAGSAAPIILSVRLPRVLCAAFSGAAFAVTGAAMQGLLKNPLADGSTLGVTAGASLGAVVAIVLNLTFPSLPFAGTMLMAILFAFLSLLFILGLTYRLDSTLSTHTIILMGVIYSMFASSMMRLLMTLSPDKVQHITFWTMGDLQNASLTNALILAVAFLLCGSGILFQSRELNALAISEENARHIGVNVKRTRLTLFVLVSILTGVCVSICGAISFVGLITPHMVRMLSGVNHRRLLPACAFGGAVFFMLADLVARILLSPVELPTGVITSLAGSVAFVLIFSRTRKRR